jgi:hypothetical protein
VLSAANPPLPSYRQQHKIEGNNDATIYAVRVVVGLYYMGFSTGQPSGHDPFSGLFDNRMAIEGRKNGILYRCMFA